MNEESADNNLECDSSRPLLQSEDFDTTLPNNNSHGKNGHEAKISKKISTLTLILSPFAILLPTLFICAVLLPPPPSSGRSMPHNDPIAPSLLSVSESVGDGGGGGGGNGQTKLVHVLDNDLYQEMKHGIFNLEKEASSFSEYESGALQSRRTKGNKYHLKSDKDEIQFGDTLTIEWLDEATLQYSRDLSSGIQNSNSNENDDGIREDDILALYCPADESDPKKFRDAATIAQARATHSRFGILSDLDNMWTIPSFPIVREDSCEFRLFAHEKQNSSNVGDDSGKSMLRWLSSSETPREQEHHYTLVASTGPIALTASKQVPTGIHISLTGNPTEMNIQFTTGVSGKPVVEIAQKSDIMKDKSLSSRYRHGMAEELAHYLKHLTEGVSWTRFEGVSTTYSATDMCQEPAISTDPGCFISPGELHTVRVTSLNPNTDYLYRVGVAAGQGMKWSDYFAFKSSPPRGPTAEPLTFLAFGDQGVEDWNNITSGGPDVTKLITNMIDNDNITIHSIHHMGDLSYAMGAAHIWDEWLDMIQPYAARVPLMVGVGNHEYDYTAGGGEGKDPSGSSSQGFHPAWGNFGDDSFGECGIPVSKRFAAPDNGNGVFWYSFEQSQVHTIMLSSEHNMTAGSTQYEWLEKDLKSVNRTLTPWIIVEMHRPLYNSEKYWNQFIVGVGMRDEIESLLHTYEVDLVLAGHYHSYLRTCHGLYRGKCNNGGPTFITVGTGGANLDDGVLIQDTWTEYFDESHHGVGRATINATSLHWEFVVVGGDVVDEVWLAK